RKFLSEQFGHGGSEALLSNPFLNELCGRCTRYNCPSVSSRTIVMRFPLIAVCSLCILSSQTTDPNKSGFPHDMIWFNAPKNPQPGVVHKGYHSAAMDKEVGYNIYLPPGYEAGSQRYPVVYWLHGRNNTESSDSYPVQYLADGIAGGKLPPMILVYASGGSQTNYCDSYDGKYMAETTVIKELIPHIDKNY